MELRQISIPIGSIDNLENHRGVLDESEQNLDETNVPPARENEHQQQLEIILRIFQMKTKSFKSTLQITDLTLVPPRNTDIETTVPLSEFDTNPISWK